MQRPMRSPGATVRGWFSRPVPSESESRTAQLRWGLAGIAVAVVALLALGLIYVLPPGTREYTAEFREAQSVQAGIDVRVAGINVGKVSSVDMAYDHVDVTFRVADDVFVGDSSSIDMRQLTTVGGYYMALIPSGRTALSKPISADRVQTPYTLMEIFQQATPKVERLDVQPARTTLAQLSDALAAQPDSIRDSIGTLNRMLDNGLRQQTQIGDFVRILNEYSTVANANGEVLLNTVRKLGVMFAATNQNLRGNALYLEQIAEFMRRIRPALQLYLGEIDPLAERVDGLVAKARQAVRDLDPVLAGAADLTERLKASIGPGGGLQTQQETGLLATELCFPSAAVKC